MKCAIQRCLFPQRTPILSIIGGSIHNSFGRNYRLGSMAIFRQQDLWTQLVVVIANAQDLSRLPGCPTLTGTIKKQIRRAIDGLGQFLAHPIIVQSPAKPIRNMYVEPTVRHFHGRGCTKTMLISGSTSPSSDLLRRYPQLPVNKTPTANRPTAFRDAPCKR
jgi:hypothetical protein